MLIFRIICIFLTTMPRQPKDLDEFRDEIERRVAAGNPQNEILAWLTTNGYDTKPKKLRIC